MKNENNAVLLEKINSLESLSHQLFQRLTIGHRSARYQKLFNHRSSNLNFVSPVEFIEASRSAKLRDEYDELLFCESWLELALTTLMAEKGMKKE